MLQEFGYSVKALEDTGAHSLCLNMVVILYKGQAGHCSNVFNTD